MIFVNKNITGKGWHLKENNQRSMFFIDKNIIEEKTGTQKEDSQSSMTLVNKNIIEKKVGIQRECSSKLMLETNLPSNNKKRRSKI